MSGRLPRDRGAGWLESKAGGRLCPPWSQIREEFSSSGDEKEVFKCPNVTSGNFHNFGHFGKENWPTNVHWIQLYSIRVGILEDRKGDGHSGPNLQVC